MNAHAEEINKSEKVRTSLTRRYARSILDTKKIFKVESKGFRTAVESPPSDQSLKRYRPLKRRRGRIFRHSVQTR